MHSTSWSFILTSNFEIEISSPKVVFLLAIVIDKEIVRIDTSFDYFLRHLLA